MKKILQKTIGILAIMIFLFGLSYPANSAERDVEQVGTVQELRDQEADGETVYELTAEAILTYQEDWRNSKYIEDGTAGILIDDNDGIITTEYEIYDGITGIKGTLSVFGNMLQFVPEEDPGEATSSDNVIDPLVISMEDFVNNFMDYQARLIIIEEVEFLVDPGESFANGQIYDFTDGDFVGEFRTTFFNVNYIGDPIPSGPLNITGLPNSRAEGDFLTARHWDDIEPLTSYSVEFDITDEENNEVENVELEFYGETLTEGPYFFEDVLVGTHPYTATKEGYHVATGQVTVSDDDVVYHLVMVEIDPNMVTDFPWHEDFSGDFPPQHWAHYALGEGGWEQDDDRAHHDYTSEGEEADSWLVTPQIQLPEDESMLISFFENNQFMTVYGYSGLLISTGSGNPEHGHFQEIYESDDNIGVGDPHEALVSLGDYVGEVVYLAFNYQGEDAHRWWIDDFMIDEAPGAIEVPDIATLKNQEVDGDLPFMITGEVIVTHLQQAYRGQFYVQDETAAILVDDPDGIVGAELELYDGITGFTGELTEFQDMLQLVPTEDPGAPSSHDNEVEPLMITLEDIDYEHQGMLVYVANVYFEEDNPDTFTHNESFYIYDDTAEGVIRTPNSEDLLDYFGEPVPDPDTPKDIIGVLHQRYEVLRLLPRMLADFMEPTDVTNLETLELRVYPNPANDLVFVESSERVIDLVQVYNIQGQLVLEQPGNASGRVQLQVSSLKPGIYMLQVSSGSGRSTQKLQIH